MPIDIAEFPLAISLDHPLPDGCAFASAVQNFIDVVPGHRMYFLTELMLHLLILILWLFGQNRNVASDIPAPDQAICAAGDQHLVLTIADEHHIQHHVLVLCHHDVFLYYLLLAPLPSLMQRGLH